MRVEESSEREKAAIHQVEKKPHQPAGRRCRYNRKRESSAAPKGPRASMKGKSCMGEGRSV